MNEKNDAVKKILETAIMQENKSKKFYLKVQEQIRNEDAKQRLKHMANAEEEHEEILKSWYEDTYGETFDPEKSTSAQHPLDTQKYEANTSLIDVVQLIASAENKAYNFYKNAAREARTPEEKRLFEKLASLEQMHADQSLTELDMLSSEEIHFSDEDVPWKI
ncbi:MAG: ferritin family protein [Candidatus Kuenenia sp.]|nr:ferritin family protein [Candidatus Kuenenia hertensis]